MGKYIERIRRYKLFVLGWLISVFSLILSRGFNIRWNFLNLIAIFAYLAQLILLGYDAIKSGKIRIRDIVYPILIVSALYGLFILINYLAYVFHS